jgi:CRISPR-associated protein Cmr3
MSRLTWRFTAFDSLFFRESRPFDTIGGSELSSIFPPSPATIAGAIRSAIGDVQPGGVVWANYPGAYPALQQQIGDSESLGKMAIKGIYLSRQNKDTGAWERLYPIPADLVASKTKAEISQRHFLQVGKAVHCDLGEAVCMAVAPKDDKGVTIKGIKPLDGYWLTQTGLSLALKGEKPALADLIPASQLFSREPRLGIARHNQQRTAQQGMLYQTQHIRPLSTVAIEVDVEGLQGITYPQAGIVRLGGEGRGAAFTVLAAENRSASPVPSPEQVIGIKLLLLTPVHVPPAADTAYSPLPGFTPAKKDGQTVWVGQINGTDLTLHCAVMGKALREGGWDLRKQQAKPVRSLIPAGSVFYCKINDNTELSAALTKLQDTQLDNQNPLDKQLGRGLITAGYWLTPDSINNKEASS